MNTATAGVWQAETSKMRSRGKLVIIQMVPASRHLNALNAAERHMLTIAQANCITGFSISNWLTLGFSFAPAPVDWRFPLAFQICQSQKSTSTGMALILF